MSCIDSTAVNFEINATYDNGLVSSRGVWWEAFNYNEQATENDGSCVAIIMVV